MASARVGVGSVISRVMIGLGIFVAGRLLMRPDEPLTGSALLDGAFALFFIARGVLYFWTQRRQARG